MILKNLLLRYRESRFLPVFVNLFAAIQYVRLWPSRDLTLEGLLHSDTYDFGTQWCRVCYHVNGGVDVVNIDDYRYFDYLFTCPLLVRFALHLYVVDFL